jgi:hypothetical protein
MIIKRKLYSQVEEKLFARGKNMRDLGKGNKKANKRLKQEKFNKLVQEKLDESAAKGINLGKREAQFIVKESNPELFGNGTHAKGLVGGTSSKTADINTLHARLTRDSGPYKHSTEQLMDYRKAAENELRKRKHLMKNIKIGAGIVAGTAVLGTGAYLAKKHHNKKKDKKED